MPLLLKDADWIVTVDAERRIIRGGSIFIEGDRIAEIGKAPSLKRLESREGVTVLDMRGKLVMPGLIDTHVHNTQQCGRGLADECDVTKHLLERLYGYERVLTEDDAYWAALACQLELIRAGTTCFVDPGSYFPEQTARAMAETGVRGIVARTAFDVHQTQIGQLPEGMFREDTETALERAEAFVKKFKNSNLDGRLRPWFALRILSGCSDELIQRTKTLADKYEVGVVMHASESRDEVVASRLRYGVSDVERMAKLGALGPRMILIHMGWASPRELRLCQEYDLKVSCTPSTGFRLGMGSMEFGHFAELLEFGVTVALGSDAAMSSNYLDIVREMFLASGGIKASRLDPTIMPPETVVEMATINGAKAALWESEIGSLEVGKKADIAAFDTRGPEWRPILNPIANLVYCSRGGADTVVIDGDVLLRDGSIQKLDEQAILTQCQERGESIGERSGLAPLIMPKWPII